MKHHFDAPQNLCMWGTFEPGLGYVTSSEAQQPEITGIFQCPTDLKPTKRDGRLSQFWPRWGGML